ncbi:MAG: FMN-binding protein [Christensenellaceae bacterium]|jgi:electron transport complex protein RnfG|nr:FMN-binding protein [Christensenellaceae bacterium]
MKQKLPAWARLAIIAVVAGLLLGFINELTAPTIAQQDVVAAEAARQAVLPAAQSFEQLDIAADAPVGYCYAGKADDAVIGHVVMVTAKGYGGEIEVVVGVDTAGVITGIDVGGSNFSETVGLGAKTKDPEFTGQFVGLQPPLTLKQNVDSVSGASISSGAVVGAVNTACEYIAGL